MKTHPLLLVAAFPLGVALSALAAGAHSCAPNDLASVVARPVADRSDLIGGPGALGDVGDWLLENERIRLIIQGEGFSRGFGVYGGSLIDADLQRVRRRSFGDSRGGLGRDNFSELFPAVFLKAMRPTSIRSVERPDGARSVLVTGGPGDFLVLAQTVNDLLAPTDGLRFTNEYRLAPGKRWVEIVTTLRNVSDDPVRLPDPGVVSLIGSGAQLEVPVGDVLLFGAGNEVFAEGPGFDLRFTLEDRLKDPPGLPQLPGLVVPFVATRGEGVSYGFTSGITDPSLSLMQRAGYEGEDPRDLLIPFLASAFSGAFYGAAPRQLERRSAAKDSCERDDDCPGGRCERAECSIACEPDGAACPVGSWCVEGVCDRSAFSFSKYFIVGDGDVASIRDAFHELRGDETFPVSGLVREDRTLAPEASVSVLVFDAAGGVFNQHTTDSTGSFIGQYPAGAYTYRVLAEGRFPTDPVRFEVGPERPVFLEIEIPPPGSVSVRISGEDGQLMPGRCSLVGKHAPTSTGTPGRTFLYDFRLGERVRPRNIEPEAEDGTSTRFVEDVIFTGTGVRRERVRPGRYVAHCSRGLEYEVVERPIDVRPGEVATLDVALRREISTPGWASGDFHLHSVNSVDSTMSLPRRVAHVAAEGVDLACSSDHNFVTDYTRAIAEQGLERWVQGMVGLEMTTLEVGHFNGFPLRYDPGPITKGAFEWSGRPPAEVFEDLRALGKYGPEQTIIQVNHPRDTIQGYFNAYNLNPDIGEPEEGQSLLFSPSGPEFGPENFVVSFDALEIVNGKRQDLLFTYTVPEVLPPPPLPEVVPPAGEVLRDADGRVAFPGGREDWFTYLNLGRLFTATGNSDTHGPEDEPGIPRNYFPVSDDRPGAIDELEVVAALKSQAVVVTSGPFVQLRVTGEGPCRRLDPRHPSPSCDGEVCGEPLDRVVCGLGEMATPGDDGQVLLEIDVELASWMDLDTLRIFRNGEVLETLRGTREEIVTRHRRMLSAAEDAWFVVELSGSRSMFPVVTPLEIEPIQVADAVDAIGSGFGFELNPFGNLRPTVVTSAYPYALTNPVYVDGSRDGRFRPPGVVAGVSTGQRTSVRAPHPNDVPVLVRMFSLFSRHAH